MTFDYIIVGAGSAGCVIANRLTEDAAVTVLLLEAGEPDKKPEIHIPGGYSKLNRTSVDWQFWSEPQDHLNGRKIYLPRGKTLGGSSSTNAMAYVRGSRYDYDEWEALGNKGWGYNNVLPYFKKSEHNEDLNGEYHGKGGPLNITYAQQPSDLARQFLLACNEAGIMSNVDYNGEEQLGAHLLQFTIKDSKRQSAATAFLKPVLGRPNLKIMTGCLVHRVIMEGGAATGVQYSRKGSGMLTAKCGKEVILTAGSFQSPQLLMLSGIGDAKELASKGVVSIQHLPGVGKNLQDHVWSGASGFSDIPSGNSVLKPWNMTKAMIQYLVWKTGPLCNSPLEANAFFKTDRALERPDMQFHFVPLGISVDYSTDIYDLSTYSKKDGFGILSVLIRPASRGYVTLRTKDPGDAPMIQPNLLSDPKDMEVLVKGLRKAIEIGETKAMRAVAQGVNFPSAPYSDEVLREHIRKSLETLYHPVGTCKMGNDEMAVVDDQLKVHGISGLRVADGSIMPTIVSGNTNAACIMIGEKASDLIRKK